MSVSISKKDLLDKYLKTTLENTIEKHLENLANEIGDCLINVEMMATLAYDNEEELYIKQHQINNLAEKLDLTIYEEIEDLKKRIGRLVVKDDNLVYECS